MITEMKMHQGKKEEICVKKKRDNGEDKLVCSFLDPAVVTSGVVGSSEPPIPAHFRCSFTPVIAFVICAQKPSFIFITQTQPSQTEKEPSPVKEKSNQQKKIRVITTEAEDQKPIQCWQRVCVC